MYIHINVNNTIKLLKDISGYRKGNNRSIVIRIKSL
jgi:hypothetical protein